MFSSAGQVLAPLEPQYANPRIEDDAHGYRMQWRLDAWRREGWPGRYPREAVQRERRGGERLVGEGGLGVLEMRRRFLGRGDGELGGVIEVKDERGRGENGEVDEGDFGLGDGGEEDGMEGNAVGNAVAGGDVDMDWGADDVWE